MNPRRSFSIAGADLCGFPRAYAASAFLVRIVRREKGWSKKEMERRTSIHTSLIRRYERGDVCPSATNWERIFKAAGIDPAFEDSLLAAAGEFAAAFTGAKPGIPAAGLTSLDRDLEELLRTAAYLFSRPSPAEPPPDPAGQLERLLSCAAPHRPDVIRITLEFHSPALARLACRESLRELERDPRAARELAVIAVAVAKMSGQAVLEEVEKEFLAQPGLAGLFASHM